jgi:transcription antitermination factor NusG
MDTVIPWFALQTRSRNERQVERLLTHKGYECFLPTYRQKRRWSDRVVEVELPLFPMYVFCRFNLTAFGKAVSTPGVTRIVRFGGQFAEVKVKEIEALQLLVRSNLLREPWAYIPDGTFVKVETGPLAGIEGVVSSGDDKRRLVISVTLLQRSVAIQLDEKTVFSVIGASKEDRSMVCGGSDLALKLIRGAKSSIATDH